jgi:hypothetical protein
MGISAGAATAIAAAASSAAAIGGGMMNANAQRSAADATAAQNRATMLAQNQGFMQRMLAANAQTESQRQVMEQTMADRNAAATQMREGQMAAMKQQQDILAAENQTADTLRAQGDTQAQNLIASTSGPNLAAGQAASQDQAAALLSSATAPSILGPSGGTDPSGSDPSTRSALACRLAEAATNYRTYGSKVGAVTSYNQPITMANNAIEANKFGIMPAQAADVLLRSGAPIQMQPAEIAYTGATNRGTATDALLQSRGQSGLDAASLSYGNATDISNLAQTDADTLAANKNKQAQENAAYAQSLATLVSGVGNLGLKGAGYYGGSPFSSKTV